MFKRTTVAFAAVSTLTLMAPAFSQDAGRPAPAASGTTSSTATGAGTAMGRSSAGETAPGAGVGSRKQKMIGQPKSASEQLLNPEH